jgi:hypothetical protein
MENIQDVQIQNLRGLMNMTFSLPEIQISSSNLYTALKILFLVAGFTVIVFNVLSVSALPPNTTDWNFGIEFIDDDLEEEEEREDEEEHVKETEED